MGTTLTEPSVSSTASSSWERSPISPCSRTAATTSSSAMPSRCRFAATSSPCLHEDDGDTLDELADSQAPEPEPGHACVDREQCAPLASRALPAQHLRRPIRRPGRRRTEGEHRAARGLRRARLSRPRTVSSEVHALPSRLAVAVRRSRWCRRAPAGCHRRRRPVGVPRGHARNRHVAGDRARRPRPLAGHDRPSPFGITARQAGSGAWQALALTGCTEGRAGSSCSSTSTSSLLGRRRPDRPADQPLDGRWCGSPTASRHLRRAAPAGRSDLVPR